MADENLHPRAALRIDVDFPVGLLRAVPFFLDGLRATGMRATFFVVAGSNRPGSVLRRLLDHGYLRRLWRLGPWKIAARVGRDSLSNGGGFIDSEAGVRVLRRIVAEGHELAVHGYDHAWWAANAWRAEESQLLRDIDRAFDAMAGAVGGKDYAWGSPNWRTTAGVLRHLEARGVPYLSDCWGTEPFLTVDDGGGVIPVVHLPITAPSLESLVLERRLGPAPAVTAMVAGLSRRVPDVVCFHDYFEGLLRPDLFEVFLEQCGRRGIETVTLREAARRIERDGGSLPAHPLTRGAVPGFSGEVSWQRSG